uniref:Secreted protein n=1 Tax=Macrostomum lignano TaxID=282301 RepID=A0A1I8FKR2_9PLAT
MNLSVSCSATLAATGTPAPSPGPSTCWWLSSRTAASLAARFMLGSASGESCGRGTMRWKFSSTSRQSPDSRPGWVPQAK